MQPKYISPSKDPLETMFSIRYLKLPLKHDMTGSSNNVLENCFFFQLKTLKKNQTMKPQSSPQTNQATVG